MCAEQEWEHYTMWPLGLDDDQLLPAAARLLAKAHPGMEY